MAFWGVEVRPGKPYTHKHDSSRGRLRITQATLGNGKSSEKSTVQCNVGLKSPVLLCNLIPGVSESCSLELEFEEDEQVVFSVLGQRSINLSGYFVSSYTGGGRDDDTDSYGEDIGHSDSDNSDVDPFSDDEYESDFIDDDDNSIFPVSSRRKSNVVIEEIIDDEKPTNGNADRRRLKKNKVIVSDDETNSLDSDDGNAKSQHDLVDKSKRLARLESEDEDGFPVSHEDRKRKISEVHNDAESKKETALPLDASTQPESGVKNVEKPKKKKKLKDMKPVETEVKTEGESKGELNGALNKDTIVLNELAVDTVVVDQSVPVSSGKLKKKNKKKFPKDEIPQNKTSLSESVVEGAHDENQDMDEDQLNTELPKDEVKEQDSKKRKKKKKKSKSGEKDGSTNEQAVGVTASDRKDETRQSKVREYSNGMTIEDVEMGQPDGKRALPGKKVSVHYTGKLKNGKVFDSNNRKKPFSFRLGIGEVIAGWDVGVKGMRVGDKRKLSIPPAMGYGTKSAGQIPPNSWLFFDVELVDVK